jgi:hypothetical protein
MKKGWLKFFKGGREYTTKSTETGLPTQPKEPQCIFPNSLIEFFNQLVIQETTFFVIDTHTRTHTHTRTNTRTQ